MAGVKGRSGGYREGAGRKPAPKPEPVSVEGRDPLDFLLDVMQGTIDPTPSQLKAAIAATQYVHTKKGEGGKKEQRQADAEGVAGRFNAAKPPPKLRAV
jgi:phage terminase small subunit